jgi:hypothetical protein
LDLKRHLPDIRESGIRWPIIGFSILIVLNLLTVPIGTERIVSYLSSNPLGPIAAVIVFDTPGTIGGLLGLLVLFTPVLFGTPVSERRRLSVFFTFASIFIAIFAGAIWDRFYDTTGVVGAGTSGVAISGQAIVFTLSFVGLLRLGMQDTRSLGRMSSYWWHAFGVIYVTLILTTIWFVAFLQSIFQPTQLYNWRVHEFCFFIAIGATVVYVVAARTSLGLERKVRIDEMLMNFHFDDLNDRFVRALPKLRVVFADMAATSQGEFHPELGQIWMPESYRGLEYFPNAKKFDDALLHAMVHADLYYSGRPWQHGSIKPTEGFNATAEGVGASPEQ